MDGGGGLFGGLAAGRADKEAMDLQKRHQQISVLADLMDNPNTTLEQREALGNQLEELIGTNKQKKGLIPLFAKLLHIGGNQQPQQPTQQPRGIWDERVPLTPASPDFGYTIQAGHSPEGMLTFDRLTEIGRPPSPESMRRGDMTNADVEDQRRFRQFEQQQLVKAKIDEENDQRTQARQVAVQNARNEAAMARTNAIIAGQSARLTQAEQLRAKRRASELATAYPNETPEQIAVRLQGEIDNEQSLKKSRRDYLAAQAKAIPARVEQEWARLDDAALRTEIYRAATGNVAEKESYRRQVEPLLIELRSVRDEIEYHQRYPTDPAQQQGLREARAHEQNLLNEIWKAKGSTAPETPAPSTVPRRGGGRSPNYVAPKVSQQDLNKTLGLP